MHDTSPRPVSPSFVRIRTIRNGDTEWVPPAALMARFSRMGTRTGIVSMAVIFKSEYDLQPGGPSPVKLIDSLPYRGRARQVGDLPCAASIWKTVYELHRRWSSRLKVIFRFEDHRHRNDPGASAHPGEPRHQGCGGNPFRISVPDRPDAHERGADRPRRSVVHAALERRGSGHRGALHRHDPRPAADRPGPARHRAIDRHDRPGAVRTSVHEGCARDGDVGHPGESGRPVYRLLGGPVRGSVPTKWSISGVEPAPAAAIAEWAVEQGF